MGNGARLLIDEYPLLVLPTLASKIGLIESVILQQINYWIQALERDKKQEPEKYAYHLHEGRVWVYNSLSGWREQFPFISEKTIYRIFKKLEQEGYLLTGNFNAKKYDQTKWYTINFENVKKLEKKEEDTKSAESHDRSFGQDGQMDIDKPSFPFRQNVALETDSLTRPIPKTTSETTSKITTNNSNVVEVLVNFGMVEKVAKDISGLVTAEEVQYLLTYAYENKLNVGWIVNAIRDPSRRPKKQEQQCDANPKCKHCKGSGVYERVVEDTDERIVISCDCVKKGENR